MPAELTGCRVCGGGVSKILDLGLSPVANALLATPDAAAPRYPLGLAHCAECDLVQQSALLADSVLFPGDYPYYSSVSTSVTAHAGRLAAAVAARVPEGAFVVEIGSNDGPVLRALGDLGVSALGVDGALGPAQASIDAGLDAIAKPFTAAVAAGILAERGKADAVIMSNVLAHMSDPLSALKAVRGLIADDGVLVIEAQSWLDLVARGAFDMVYHEHHAHFSLTSLAALLERAGFGIAAWEHVDMQGGSIRAWCAPGRTHDASVTGDIRAERAKLDRSADALVASVRRFRTSARAFVDGLRDEVLWGYGAAAKTVTLLAAAECELPLVAIADAAPSKIGMFSPIGGAPILSPADMAEAAPDLVILFAWNLAKEIVPLYPGVEFWAPVPVLRPLG